MAATFPGALPPPTPPSGSLEELRGLAPHEISYLKEAQRDTLARQNVAGFETAFASHDTSVTARELNRGTLDGTGERLRGQVIEVGTPDIRIQLVSTVWPMGEALMPPRRRAVSGDADLLNGDPMTALDHFLQEKLNGNMTNATTPKQYVPPYPKPVGGLPRSDSISGRADRERANEQISAAVLDVNAWQIIYTSQNNDRHGRPVGPVSLEFASVIPSAEGADPRDVPTYDDMARTFQTIQDVAGLEGRTIELHAPLDEFTA